MNNNEKMKARKVKPETFKDFINAAPEEIQDLFEKAKTVKQSANWHPEGDVYTHIGIVFNRAKKTKDINFMMGAFFHDLGKVNGTTFIPPNKYSAHGHEFGSLRLVEKYKDWIESLGANYEIVHFIVKFHMKVKLMHEMRPSKREALRAEKYYEYVNKFSAFDDMQTDYSNDIDR